MCLPVCQEGKGYNGVSGLWLCVMVETRAPAVGRCVCPGIHGTRNTCDINKEEVTGFKGIQKCRDACTQDIKQFKTDSVDVCTSISSRPLGMRRSADLLWEL